MVNVKLINRLQDECLEKVYNEVSIFHDKCDGLISNHDKEYEEILIDLHMNIEEYRHDPVQVLDILDEYNISFEILTKKYLEYRKNLFSSFMEEAPEFEKKAFKTASNVKDRKVISFRLISFRKYINNMLRAFSEDYRERLLEINEEYSKGISTFLTEKIEPKLDDDTMEFCKTMARKILGMENENSTIGLKKSEEYDYKSVVKLALEHGYEYKWSKGSHSIYEHSKSNKIVVIPTHSLGVGLSKKIQKQIVNNSKILGDFVAN